MKSNISDPQINPGEIWIVFDAIVYTLCKIKDEYPYPLAKDDLGKTAWKVLVLSTSNKFTGGNELDSILEIFVNMTKKEHFLKISQEEFCNAVKKANY